MRRAVSIPSLIAAVVLVALGAVAGWSPAEAKGPPKSRPHGRDITPPTLTVPSDITTAATVPFGARVTFSVTATDDKDPAPVVVVSPPSGSTFRIGTTTVTATATDWKGNATTESFNVTVESYGGGDVAYKAYFFVDDGSTWFEWDITVHADGSVSGTGAQSALLVYDWYWGGTWSDTLPSGLSGTGTVSGTIGTDASCTFTSSRSFWYWDEFTDDDGNPIYAEDVGGFSGASTASVDPYGNLSFSPEPLAEPVGYWTFWFRQ